MQWIDSQLSTWWILIPLSWVAGFVLFLVRRDSRDEAAEYWEKLKDVAFNTFLVTGMGFFLLMFPIGALKLLLHLLGD